MGWIGIFNDNHGSDVNFKKGFGDDVVLNGDFDDNSVWTCQANWTITGGILRATGVLANTYTKQACLIVGRKYRVRLTILNYVSGTYRVKLGGCSGATWWANGTYENDIICTSNTNLYIFCIVGGTCDFDDISCKEIINIEENG